MPSITLNLAKHNAETAGISAATLAKLFGISAGAMSNAFRGIGYLGSEREASLLTLTTRIVELQESLRPLREPTDVGELRRLLDALEQRGITPEFVRSNVNQIFGNE